MRAKTVLANDDVKKIGQLTRFASVSSVMSKDSDECAQVASIRRLLKLTVSLKSCTVPTRRKFAHVPL